MRYYCLKYENSYFARDNRSSLYLTTNRSEAVKYEENHKTKLQNIKRTLPKKYIKSKVSIACFEVVDQVEDDITRKRIDIKNEEKCDEYEYDVFDDIEGVKKRIDDLSKNFKDILDSKSELLRQLSEIDTKISDELHYIEFYKFSASEGYKLCKQLQEFRDERRKIKKKLEIINIIQTQTCSGIALGSTSKAFNIVDNKMYSPRILTELFEGKENRRRKIG